jgi:hypothetical protein
VEAVKPSPVSATAAKRGILIVGVTKILPVDGILQRGAVARYFFRWDLNDDLALETAKMDLQDCIGLHWAQISLGDPTPPQSKPPSQRSLESEATTCDPKCVTCLGFSFAARLREPPITDDRRFTVIQGKDELGLARRI